MGLRRKRCTCGVEALKTGKAGFAGMVPYSYLRTDTTVAV